MTLLSKDSIQQPLPWWTSPFGIGAGFLIPVFLLIAYSGSSNFPGLTVRGLPYLTADYILLGIGVIAVICVSGWVGAQITSSRRGSPASAQFEWERAALASGLVCLFGYVMFFKPLLLNPLLLLRTFTGAYRPDRTNMELTAGVTSFDNFAPVFFSIYAYRSAVLGVRFSPHLRLLCWLLLGSTALRVYVWSERLALIEAIVPFGLAYAAKFSRTAAPTWRFVQRGGPFLALPVLILYFGLAEYFRSWQSSTYKGKTGFWEFAIGRLASYYYTSLNNGAGVLATSHWPTFQFENTLLWLHRAPVIGPVFSYFVGLRAEALGQFLVKYGDEEFNNPSGIYSVIYDLGLPLGFVYFSVFGFLAGRLFTAYRAQSVPGVLGYPLFFLSLLEIFRYPYLGSPRGFTWILGIGVAVLAGRFRRNRAPVSSGPQPLPADPGIER